MEGQITDLRTPGSVCFPFRVTALCCCMWGTLPVSPRFQATAPAVANRGCGLEECGQKATKWKKGEKEGAALSGVWVTGFFKSASEVPLPWMCQKCEALTLQTREVQVYALGKEDFLKAARQLQDSEEKEEDNTFSRSVCGGRCTPRVMASRRNWGLAGELSINHPGECPWQQGENSHSFPQDCAAAAKRRVSTERIHALLGSGSRLFAPAYRRTCSEMGLR